MNKGTQGKQPKLAGLNELDFTTAQTDTPHTDFAGIAKLPVSWIMESVIAFTKPSPTEGGKGK
jgi:hypothetical protein